MSGSTLLAQRTPIMRRRGRHRITTPTILPHRHKHTQTPTKTDTETDTETETDTHTWVLDAAPTPLPFLPSHAR